MTFKQFKEWTTKSMVEGKLPKEKIEACLRVIDAVEDEIFLFREHFWKESYEQLVLKNIVNNFKHKIED